MSSQASNVDDPVGVYRRAYVEAAKTADIGRIVSFLADDVVSMPPNDTTLYGKDEALAWWEEYFQYFRIVSIIETERDVTVIDDWAVERSASAVSIAPKTGGTRIRDEVRMFAIWKRQPDGSWKISQQIWNSIKPVGAGTTRFMSRMMQKKAGAKRGS